MVGSPSLVHDTTARWLLETPARSTRAASGLPWHRVAAWIALAMATLWSWPLRAESMAARLSIPKGSQVQIAVLKDGFHVGVLAESVEAHALAEALANLHATTCDVQPLGSQRVFATLQFARPVSSARAVLVRSSVAAKASDARPSPSPSAAAAGNATLAEQPNVSPQGLTPAKPVRAGHVRVDVCVSLVEPRDALSQHVLAQRLPLPETLAHHRLWDAEEALVAGRLAEAQLMFEGLNTQGPLVGWAMLRLGDLAAHNGMQTLACQHYEHAGKLSDVRVPSTLAGMRARVLDCAHAPSVDYNAMLSRVGRDDPVGRRLAAEATWALGFERDVQALDAVVGLGKRNAIVPAALYDAVAARRLRLRDPMQRILAERRVPIDPRQEESFDLSLSIGQAWCALDVPERWQRPKPAWRTWWTGSLATKQRALLAVQRCDGLDHPRYAAALSRAHSPPVLDELRDIEARIARAKQVASQRFGSSPSSKRSMSKSPKATAPPAPAGR